LRRSARLSALAVLAPLAVTALLGAGGCQTVDLGAPPADVNLCEPGQMFFLTQIWPNFLGQDYNGVHCYDSNCHGPNPKGALALINSTEPMTLPLQMEWAANYTSASHLMNCSDPVDSRLIALPEGKQTHGGGMLIDPNSPQGMQINALLSMWITQP
jgi:hypothetical protein